MLTMLQVQAFRATGDRKYIDHCDAKEMAAYLDNGCSSPTASSSMPPMCSISGDAATAGSPPAWPRRCVRFPPTTRFARAILAGYKLR